MNGSKQVFSNPQLPIRFGRKRRVRLSLSKSQTSTGPSAKTTTVVVTTGYSSLCISFMANYSSRREDRVQVFPAVVASLQYGARRVGDVADSPRPRPYFVQVKSR